MAVKQNSLFQLLKTRFVFLWFSQLFSQITVNLLNFILSILVFEITKSTAAVSLIWFFYAVPTLILGPFSGTIVDLTERRKLLFLTNLTQSLIVFAYFLLYLKQSIGLIYILIFLYSLVNQLYLPAEGATIPFLVSKKSYPLANTIFMLTANTTFLISFIIAGPMVRLFGKFYIFLLGGSCLFLAAVSVLFLPKGIRGERKTMKINGFFKKVKEGYFYIKNNSLILFPLLIIVSSQIILGILAIIIPAYSQEILKIPLIDAGLVVVSPAGVGALLGSLLVVKKLRKKLRKKIIVSTGLGLAFLCFIALGLIVPFLGKEKIIISVILGFLLGVSFVSLVIPSQTFIQEVTPKKFFGRIYGILGFLITLGSILPILIMGVIVDLLGVKLVLIVIGIISGLMFLISLKEPYELIKNNHL